MEAWISGCLSGASFLSASLIGSQNSHLTIREYFPVSYIVYHVFGHDLYLHAWTTSLDHVHVWSPEPTGFILRTRWVIFWQPWTFMSRSRSLDCDDLTVANQSAQWKRGLAVVCPEPLFFQPPWDSHLSTHEYFSVFLYCISCFCAS